MMSRFLLASLFVSTLLSLPARAALILTLDQPMRAALPGAIVSFTGTITNTGPESFLAGVDVQFAPPPSSAFGVALPVALAGFTPGPGGVYTGTIFAVTVSPSAVPGNVFTTLTTVTGSQPGGSLIRSNGIPTMVLVSAVPEPGSALLLAVPVLALIALRRYPRFRPVNL